MGCQNRFKLQAIDQRVLGGNAGEGCYCFEERAKDNTPPDLRTMRKERAALRKEIDAKYNSQKRATTPA